MEKSHLYRRIVDAIRDDILSGAIKPGAALPPVRKMTERWNCTTGTILRAYQELAHQGLIVSHVGRGTKVVECLPELTSSPLRKATLYNRTEAFLLETITAGFTPDEIEQSLWTALDRWKTYSSEPNKQPPSALRFIGSHDPSLAMVAAHFHEANPELTLQLSFSGSLGGLIALAERRADLAGCHLWDEATDTYNEPFVRKLLPGQKVALLTLAHRRIGLIFAAENPLGLNDLKDLARPGVRFVNRQQGSGTRVWLDAHLQHAGIHPSKIAGYLDEKMTHSEVALSVNKGWAEVGLGVETAALTFGLGFKLLNTERYDLIIPEERWELDAVQALHRLLATDPIKAEINNLGGYDTKETGTLRWIA